MQLRLTIEQARELRVLLDEALREMSHEIAGTDNAEFRARLLDRRRQLAELSDATGRLLSDETAPRDGESGALLRDRAHQGG